MKKKRVLIILSFIAFTLLLIDYLLKDTYAYYEDSNSLPILSSKVGDFGGDGEGVKTGPLTDSTTDINVILYTQMPDNPNRYKETKYVPASGYKVNSKVSNCYPTSGEEVGYSNGTIKEDGTVSFDIRDDKPTQITCRIYYDRDKLSDIVVYAMIKDDNGDKKFGTDNYKLTNTILDSYTYVGYECSNDKIITDLTYNTSTKKFTFKTTGPNTCYAYFK